jgi:hypothetical protein
MSKHELTVRPGFRTQRNCKYDDFYVNGTRLSDILKVSDPITPFGWLGTEKVSRSELEDRFARMILGTEQSDLRTGRVPIFICGECADYGCGVTTCRVTVSDTIVEWSDFGWDNNYKDETHRIDAQLTHHFYFDRELYDAIFRPYTIVG